MGELLDEREAWRIRDFMANAAGREILGRFDFAKVGIAGALATNDWQSRWLSWADNLPPRTQPVLVRYVDQAADPPDMGETINFAITKKISTLLLDTWSKDSWNLLDWIPENQLKSILNLAEKHGIAIALAGSLTPETVERTVVMSPSIIAVRTAACKAGRSSNLCARKIRRLRKALHCQSPNPGTLTTEIPR